METQIQEKRLPSKRNIMIISLITFLLLVLAAAAQFTYIILKYDRIYSGVYINGIAIGRMNRADAEKALNKKYGNKVGGTVLTLETKNGSYKLKFSDIDVSYNLKGTVDKAFSVGRTGNLFKRLYDIYRTNRAGMHIDIEVSYDIAKLEKIIQTFYNDTFIGMKESELLIQPEKVSIRSGHHGESINKENAFKLIKEFIDDFKGGVINIPLIITAPAGFNLESLYTQINIPPGDAYFTVKNNTIATVPHVVGRSINKETLAEQLITLKDTEDTGIELPVVFTMPEIKTDTANLLLFRDKLSTMSTHFPTSTTNDKNRSENIKLAVSLINGKILAPGEIFSFNAIVGPRTAEGGYKVAHTYFKGKIVDGIGGGICQVSTTLYNAVLFADLQVLERRNHMLTVAYVPKGRDATVSYGSVDFKFKNTTGWPLKITGEVTKKNNVIFTLTGTDDKPGRIVEIEPQIIKTTAFNTVYIDDPDLPEGETKVKQVGMTGYVVDTYKVIKQGGKIISRVKLHTSVYQTLDQEVIRGKKTGEQPAVPPVTPLPQPTPLPSPASTPVPSPSIGVDDADNPPAPP